MSSCGHRETNPSSSRSITAGSPSGSAMIRVYIRPEHQAGASTRAYRSSRTCRLGGLRYETEGLASWARRGACELAFEFGVDYRHQTVVAAIGGTLVARG